MSETIKAYYDVYRSNLNIFGIDYHRDCYNKYKNEERFEQFKKDFYLNYTKDDFRDFENIFDEFFVSFCDQEKDEILSELAQCSEDNLLVFFENNQDKFSEGTNLIFSVKIKQDNPNEIEINNPCNVCMYNFVSKFGEKLQKSGINLEEKVDFIDHRRISAIVSTI